MKKLFCLALCLALVTPLFAQTKSTAASKLKFKTLTDSISYSLGSDFGKNISNVGLDITLDFFMQGTKDALEKKAFALSEEEIVNTLNKLQAIMAEKQQQAIKEQLEKVKKESEAFLADNKKNKDVITTPSGLQYKVITKGNGKIPTAQDTVLAHYVGTLVDGTVFDSSVDRGEPASFALSAVIKGWSEALQMMPVGSKWMLYIPSDLAYGDNGAGQVIPPGAAIIFEVELISIQ